MADLSPQASASHKARLNFERVAGYMIASIVGIYASVGLVSKDMADRVVELAPALNGLAVTLGAVMGASWFRGHFDQRINGDDK